MAGSLSGALSYGAASIPPCLSPLGLQSPEKSSTWQEKGEEESATPPPRQQEPRGSRETATWNLKGPLTGGATPNSSLGTMLGPELVGGLFRQRRGKAGSNIPRPQRAQTSLASKGEVTAMVSPRFPVRGRVGGSPLGGSAGPRILRDRPESPALSLSQGT